MVSQVKKLQVMLRQANDQLERTMSEKQELEDSVKQGNEETTAKVCPPSAPAVPPETLGSRPGSVVTGRDREVRGATHNWHKRRPG